jgi:hypothetical protein
VLERAGRQRSPVGAFRPRSDNPIEAAEEVLSAARPTEPLIDVKTASLLCGARVVRHRFSSDALSGFLLKLKDESVIGTNARHSERRQRFTVAHELGHLVLRHHADYHLDLTFVGVFWRPTWLRPAPRKSREHVRREPTHASGTRPARLSRHRARSGPTRDALQRQRGSDGHPGGCARSGLSPQPPFCHVFIAERRGSLQLAAETVLGDWTAFPCYCPTLRNPAERERRDSNPRPPA